MICGNDPTVTLTPGDRAMIDWYRAWLTWTKLPADQRATTPEPLVPDGGEQPALPACVEGARA